MGSPKYTATLKQKEEIKFAFLYRSMVSSQRQFTVAILTTNGKFYEHRILLVKHHISKTIGLKIKQMLSGYLLTPSSEVMVFETFGYYEPIYFYFDFVHQHVPFRRRQVTLMQILRRICSHHKGIFKNKKLDEITPRYMPRIWKWMIAKKKCPWITEEYDNYISRLSEYGRTRDRMIVRLAMYYAFISLMYRQKNERIDAKKALVSQMQKESQQDFSGNEEVSKNGTLSFDEI